ncbi:XdhC family protein [Bacillus sp. JJ1764]|uniref:XdhC family protein n=1 Tax=Bacillus sp. JJ1764 TaxID=3122964 RepID=UPI002FFF7E1A
MFFIVEMPHDLEILKIHYYEERVRLKEVLRMTSDHRVMELLSNYIQHQHKGVLATVISVEGSAYKREGAKMIIEPNGHSYGIISGGCLEADVIQNAELVLKSGKACIKRYNLNEDYVWGLGLGCPGTVEIWIEPIGNTDIWNKMAELQSCCEPNVVCRLLTEHGKAGPRLIITENEVFGELKDAMIKEKLVLISRAKLAQLNARSEMLAMDTLSGDIRVFLDVFLPPPQLFIFGAGYDVVPLVNISQVLGFHTTIIDSRETYNTKERFPSARLILAGPEKYCTIGKMNKQSYIVIMNHHLERDMESLAFAMRTESPYIGLLGPKKRRENLLNLLEEQNIIFSKNQLEKLHSPIGLDIGAVSSEEIAVSIISEILAFRNGHKGAFLRDSPQIHHKRSRELEEQV